MKKQAVRDLLWYVILFLLLSGCSGKNQGSEANNIRSLEEFDPNVKAAYAIAQDSLFMFIGYYKNFYEDPTYAFYVKTSFTENDETEHMWSLPFDISDTGFTCILNNDPIHVKNIQAGDTVVILFDKVEDFIVTKSDSIIAGHYLQKELEKGN